MARTGEGALPPAPVQHPGATSYAAIRTPRTTAAGRDETGAVAAPSITPRHDRRLAAVRQFAATESTSAIVLANTGEPKPPCR